jgi:hypothetical protein
MCDIFRICLVGNRLLTKKSIVDAQGVVQCNKNATGPIFRNYCGNITMDDALNSNDPYCMFFLNNSVEYIDGIPGLLSGKVKGLLRNCLFYFGKM